MVEGSSIVDLFDSVRPTRANLEERMGKIWDMPKDFKVFRWDVTWSPTAQINTSTIVMGRFCTDVELISNHIRVLINHQTAPIRPW